MIRCADHAENSPHSCFPECSDLLDWLTTFGESLLKITTWTLTDLELCCWLLNESFEVDSAVLVLFCFFNWLSKCRENVLKSTVKTQLTALLQSWDCVETAHG